MRQPPAFKNFPTASDLRKTAENRSPKKLAMAAERAADSARQNGKGLSMKLPKWLLTAASGEIRATRELS